MARVLVLAMQNFIIPISSEEPCAKAQKSSYSTYSRGRDPKAFDRIVKPGEKIYY